VLTLHLHRSVLFLTAPAGFCGFVLVPRCTTLRSQRAASVSRSVLALGFSEPPVLVPCSISRTGQFSLSLLVLGAARRGLVPLLSRFAVEFFLVDPLVVDLVEPFCVSTIILGFLI
jgi:hypothetical protein